MIYDPSTRPAATVPRRSRGVALAVCIVLALSWGSTALIAQQQPAPTSPQDGGTPAPSSVTPSTMPSTDPLSNVALPGEEDGCRPPSANEKIMIGVGSVALLVVLFFLLVRLMERRYIQQDRSATMGRHVGISLTLFLTAGGFLALVYLITGCIHPSMWLWLAFWGVVWAIHGLYTLIAARGN